MTLLSPVKVTLPSGPMLLLLVPSVTFQPWLAVLFTAFSWPTLTASLSLVPAETLVIFSPPASMPPLLTLGPPASARPLLSSLTSLLPSTVILLATSMAWARSSVIFLGSFPEAGSSLMSRLPSVFSSKAPSSRVSAPTASVDSGRAMTPPARVPMTFLDTPAFPRERAASEATTRRPRLWFQTLRKIRFINCSLVANDKPDKL